MADLEITGVSDAVVSWGPAGGEFEGLSAEGQTYVVEVQLDDSASTSMKVSSDGRGGSISVNSRCSGTATVRLSPGSSTAGILKTIFLNKNFRAARDDMVIQNLLSNQVITLECAIMETIPAFGISEEPEDYLEFTFLFARMTCVGSDVVQDAIADRSILENLENFV